MVYRNNFAGIVLIIFFTALPCMAEVVNEIDSNFDGKIDQWQYVDSQGKVEKIEHDGDFDGNHGLDWDGRCAGCGADYACLGLVPSGLTG